MIIDRRFEAAKLLRPRYFLTLPEFAEGCAKNRNSLVFLIFAVNCNGFGQGANFPDFSIRVDPGIWVQGGWVGVPSNTDQMSQSRISAAGTQYGFKSVIFSRS